VLLRRRVGRLLIEQAHRLAAADELAVAACEHLDDVPAQFALVNL